MGLISRIVAAVTVLAASHAWAAKVVVVMKGEGSVAVLDDKSFALWGRVKVGEGPHEVVASADGKRAFVTNYGTQQSPGSSISVIDLVEMKEEARVDLGSMKRPHGLVEYGGKIYFTAEGAAVVGRLDPATKTVDWVFGTGQGGSHMLAICPRSGRIFTADVASNTVTSIDPPDTPGAALPIHIPTGPQPEGIAISPDGRWVWAGHRLGGDVSVIDTRLDKVVATIKVGGVPIRITFTPDGKTVVVSEPTSGNLILFDAVTRKEVGRIPVGKGAASLAFSQDGTKAFVPALALGHVVVVDWVKKEVLTKVDAGNDPDGITVAYERPVAKPLPPASLGLGLGLTDKGITVTNVAEGSPAEKSGFKTGDLLLSVDELPVDGPNVFQRYVKRCRAGDEVEVTVKRNDKEETLQVKFGEPGPT